MDVVRTVGPTDIELDATARETEVLREMAATVRRSTDEATLAAIHHRLKPICIPDRLAFWNSPLRGRRTSNEMLASEDAWGCSAHAQVAYHLARACGIPSILVKSLNVTWIGRDNRGGGRASGHVYVEVLIDGGPCLWDAQSGRLLTSYDPQSLDIEGRRIYDKGGPEEVVLSHHGTAWEDETRRLYPRKP